MNLQSPAMALSINPLPPFGKVPALGKLVCPGSRGHLDIRSIAYRPMPRAGQKTIWFSLEDKIGVAPGFMEAHLASFRVENGRLLATM